MVDRKGKQAEKKDGGGEEELNDEGKNDGRKK
jgi:hypothetical protein